MLQELQESEELFPSGTVSSFSIVEVKHPNILYDKYAYRLRYHPWGNYLPQIFTVTEAQMIVRQLNGFNWLSAAIFSDRYAEKLKHDEQSMLLMGIFTRTEAQILVRELNGFDWLAFAQRSWAVDSFEKKVLEIIEGIIGNPESETLRVKTTKPCPTCKAMDAIVSKVFYEGILSRIPGRCGSCSAYLRHIECETRLKSKVR